MKVKMKTLVIVNGFVCLAFFMLCGCYEEQSYFENKSRYYISLEALNDAANRPGGIDKKYKQQEIERYALVVQDALTYVQHHSTERMKQHVARGETWLVGDSSEGTYSSYSPPKYALDFTCFILTGIHET